MIPSYLLPPFAILFVILTVVGVLGNAIVIIAIAGDKKMRKSVMNILLLNLAVADLLNLVLTTCEWIPIVTRGRIEWLLPEMLCAFCRYLEFVFLFASISTQVIVCIERYIAIVHPMRARVLCRRRNALLAVAAAWTLVAAFAAPYAVHHKVQPGRAVAVCSNSAAYETSWWGHYKLAEFLSFYLCPLILISAVYSRVVRCLWAHNPHLDETRKSLKTTKRNDSLRMRRNVVKMLLACVAVYFLCYSPIQILFVSKHLLHINYTPPYAFLLVGNALAMTCSASNPLMYTLFSLKFRRKLKTLLACCFFVSRVDEKANTKESKTLLVSQINSNIVSTGDI